MTFPEATRFLIFWCEDDSYVYEVPTLQINPEEMKRLSQEDLSVLVRETNPGSELETGRLWLVLRWCSSTERRVIGQ